MLTGFKVHYMPSVASKTAKSSPALRQVLERNLTGRLKLRHIELLVALDNHRKLNLAAVEMHLSQPAASKMLGEIEKIAGAALFTRLPRGIEPTICGEVLIRHSRTVLAELIRAGEELGALQTGTGGSIAVGAVMAPAVDILVDAIAELRHRLPDLQVSVDVEPSNALIQRLFESKLDFVIARIPIGVDPSPFEYEEIGPEIIGLMVRPEHPLAAKTKVIPADLADCEWVLPPHGSLLRFSIESMLKRHFLPPPRRVLNTASILMTLVMAAKTDAIAPLALSVTEIFVQSANLCLLAFKERITVEPFGLIRIKDRTLPPAAQLLYDIVAQSGQCQVETDL